MIAGSQCALDHGRGWEDPKPHARFMHGRCGRCTRTALGPRCGTGPHRDGRALARTLAELANSGWRNSHRRGIDHRSLEAQGIALEPQSQIGRPRNGSRAEGIEAPTARRCTARSHAAMARGSSRIPIWAWTRSRSSNRPFTRRDYSEVRAPAQPRIEQFTKSSARCAMRPDRGPELGKDARGEDHFTTRADIEGGTTHCTRAAETHGRTERHEMNAPTDGGAGAAEARGLSFRATRPMLWRMSRMAIWASRRYAGTGIERVLGVAREAWKQRATRSGAQPCPASPRKISKADRASRRAPSPA